MKIRLKKQPLKTLSLKKLDANQATPLVGGGRYDTRQDCKTSIKESGNIDYFCGTL